LSKRSIELAKKKQQMIARLHRSGNCMCWRNGEGKAFAKRVRKSPLRQINHKRILEMVV